MSEHRSEQIRGILLGLLAEGSPVPRIRLLRAVAQHLGVPPEQRKLRAEVARQTRKLEQEGRLVDAGPEVYLADGRSGSGAG